MTRTVALLTDFGLRDTYVGVMKAVMRRICSTVDFIDISHAIQPQNVREAALALMTAYAYFPLGTVFLVVVDPGVGTKRRLIAAAAGDYCFVAPDNGVLTYALASEPGYKAVELVRPDYRLQPVSQTFHGRDIFAPAAAHLAAGVPLEDFGPAVDALQMLPLPELNIDDHLIRGEVIHIDHFGNIVTSIGEMSWLDEAHLRLTPRFNHAAASIHFTASQVAATIGSERITGIARTYGEVRQGDRLALIGSSGFLELAVNQGNCAAQLNAAVGDRVELRIT
jgi:S-adenosyl-L-methionine hydrolase (adenosine-forming)